MSVPTFDLPRRHLPKSHPISKRASHFTMRTRGFAILPHPPPLRIPNPLLHLHLPNCPCAPEYPPHARRRLPPPRPRRLVENTAANGRGANRSALPRANRLERKEAQRKRRFSGLSADDEMDEKVMEMSTNRWKSKRNAIRKERNGRIRPSFMHLNGHKERARRGKSEKGFSEISEIEEMLGDAGEKRERGEGKRFRRV